MAPAQNGREVCLTAKSLSIPFAVLISAIACAVYGWAVFLTTFEHPGVIGLNWNTPGQDWMVIYSATRSLADHNMGLIFDGDRLTSYMNKAFSAWLSRPISYHPFLYPPSFILFVTPFAHLGFLPSYAAFQILSGLGLFIALEHNADQPRFARFVSLSAIISPAAATTVVAGQIAFFVALCMVAGMRSLEKRPVLAALFLSLLSFKPQFFLLIPVALIAARQWRCLLYLMLFGLLSVILTAAVFGTEIWSAWIKLTVQNAFFPDAKWFDVGRNWGNSVYACAIAFGLPGKFASGLQLLALIVSAAFVYRAYASSIRPDQKLSILLASSMLAAPHSGLYDGIVLVIASALWLVETRPGREMLVRWALALVLWMVPVFGPPYIAPPAGLLPFIVTAFIVWASTDASRRLATSQTKR